jgi:hypothetical protein
MYSGRFPIKNAGDDGEERNEVLGRDVPVGRLLSLWFLREDTGKRFLPGIDFLISKDTKTR